MKWVFSYLKPLTGRICGGITVKIIGTLAELLIPFLLSHILENVIETNDIGAILFYGGLMAVCALIAGLGNIIANRMSAISAGKITLAIRHDLFCKLQYLSAAQLDELTIPELERVLAFANKAASITTSRHGAIPAMPTLEEMER